MVNPVSLYLVADSSILGSATPPTVDETVLLDHASRLLDLSSVYMNCTLGIVAVATVIITIIIYYFQQLSSDLKNKEIQMAIAKTAADLAKNLGENDEFAQAVVGAVFKRDDLSEFLRGLIEQEVQTKAAQVITKEFIDEKHRSMERAIANDSKRT